MIRTGPAVFLFAATLCGQDARPAQDQKARLITEKRVTEVVEFLASDAMAGRDTPSKGLDKAAEFIAAAFKKAGIRPIGSGKSYFHTYGLPGSVVDSSQVKVVLHMADGSEGVVLKPGTDIRVYRATGRKFDRDDSSVTVVGEANAATRLRRSAARDPILITVDPKTSAVWREVAGKRSVLSSRRRISRAPWILVREAAMPEGEIDHAEVWLAAPKAVTLELKNVVGMLRGRQMKDEYVMFSSHYDHIGIGLPIRGDGINNGADDDATGTTAVVTLAEAFAKAHNPHDRSLLFVCFSGEEKGMLGSRAFAADPPVPLAKIAVNLNLEMIGRPDQIKPMQAWVTGSDLSNFESISKIGFERAGIEIVKFRMASMLFTGSDNISLARKGVVAHSISAGSLHADYHKPTDHVAKLDIPNMTAVIRGIYEAGVEFATRKQRPAYNARGLRNLRLDRK